MTVPTIHEDDATELELPGRRFRWLVSPDRIASKYCSVCVISIPPGERVRPAHSHPNGEEAIYVMSGHGRVLVDGEVAAIRAGSTVLFPQGAVHMVHNQSHEPMKVVCFFAPPTSLDNYRMHDGIDFPD
jgi:quercetin dioxygenase-like cupin family protein